MKSSSVVVAKSAPLPNPGATDSRFVELTMKEDAPRQRLIKVIGNPSASRTDDLLIALEAKALPAFYGATSFANGDGRSSLEEVIDIDAIVNGWAEEVNLLGENIAEAAREFIKAKLQSFTQPPELPRVIFSKSSDKPIVTGL